jgi:cellulose synthase/poly-beta-1,6-N-acetylglucosamine synthase-like glycosyltransferase
MTSGLGWLFWICLFVVGYSYVGYGALLYLLIQVRSWFSRKPTRAKEPYEPLVCLIVPAYNEEGFIRRKMENTFELDYPREKLDILFITDGSTDETPNLVRAEPRIRHLHQEGRMGKAVAINRAMEEVKAPIVVFCDANTLLNADCVRELVKFFADPAVGGVAGEKKVNAGSDDRAAGAGEGLYWRYESLLKQLDAQWYTVVGAAGELFAIRTALYEPLPADSLLDDFVLSMRICQKGYRIQYEPKAYAVESASATMKEEQKRKIRISAGAFQSMVWLKALLNPFRYPALSFQYISHRVLRWAICPFCLVLLLVSNLMLCLLHAGAGYYVLLGAQLLFYAIASAGWILASRNIRFKPLYVPYYFLFMNVSVFIGLSRYLSGTQSTLWDKAARSVG